MADHTITATVQYQGERTPRYLLEAALTIIERERTTLTEKLARSTSTGTVHIRRWQRDQEALTLVGALIRDALNQQPEAPAYA